MLAVASVASFPCWSYSERWGYRPSLAAAILLVFVALAAAGSRESRVVPTKADIAALPSAAPSPRSDKHDTSRKVLFLPRDLETTQRDTGL
jgi:hypothetical protein